ncbi:hypothetical protein A0H81_04401 [Grifola frondosa]|uniref:Uncharacterized protein n=1 Tax=Grifola frondosa TaxID=5627 RepID=A0A1C7MFE6_GRIFR|nr:hypothetical protein A0H81_04401 [Grifola frondosa]
MSQRRFWERKFVSMGFKVVGLRPNDQDSHTTDVTFDGGADGSRSTVRRVAGVGWADPDGENIDETAGFLTQLIIADVVFNSPHPFSSGRTVNILSPRNAFLVVPLPPAREVEKEVYRITVSIHPSWGPSQHSPSLEYLQSLMDMWGPNSTPSIRAST